jgi:hypothetical protein
MAQVTVTGSINVDSLNWRNNDFLIVNNGATVTINTNQVKYWQGVNVNNGILQIENTSSTTPLRFLMGRAAGATPNIISGSAGLGIINITGSWIYLNTGSGLPNQSMSQPYTDFVPAVWVETRSGSGDFEPWFNITSQIGESLQYFKKDLEFAYTGSTGKFFIQQSINEPYPATFTGSISSSATTLVQSGVQLLYTSSIYFGNNINGNVLSPGARVRIPNIMVTDVSALNILGTTSANSANFLGAAGCVYRFNTVLFDESYGNFTQPQVLEMRNCGWAEYPLISECYSLTIDNVALSSHPIRRTFGVSTGWITRDLRWGTQCAWSYISNASINNLYICNHGPNLLFSNQNTATAATTANTPLYLSYTNNLSVNNLKVFQPYRAKSFQYGLTLNYVNNSSFNNIETYGGDFFNIQNSNNNTFTGITASIGFQGETPSFTTAWRIGIDPNTNDQLVLGKKYYIKTRAYRSWQDPTGSYPLNNVYFNQTGSEFVDSIQYSFTPYTASRNDVSYRNHPDYFGVIPAVPGARHAQPTSSLVWIQRAPAIGYEIYRSSSAGFTQRDSTSLVYSSSTVATVTFNDTSSASKPMLFDTPYYYVLRKYDQGGIWSESGEQEMIPQSIPSASNYIIQSNAFTDTIWTKASLVATADQKLGPNDVPIATSAAPTSDSLMFSTPSSSIVNRASASIVAGAPYVFSVYLSSLTSSVSMSISASSGGNVYSSSYVLNQRWIRATLPFIPGNTTASVGIFGNGQVPARTLVYAHGAQINTGSNVTPYVATTTAPTTQRPAAVELTAVRPWSRGVNGSGVEVTFAAAPAGTLWWELHMSTASNFTPSTNTVRATSWPIGAGNTIYLTNASNNTFTGLNQLSKCGYGCTGIGVLTMVNASSNNRFLNFDLDYNYSATDLITVNTLANNNFIHNWRVNNYRNYIATNYPIIAVNNAQGLVLQNVYFNNADVPLAPTNVNLDVQYKNVTVGNGRPGTTVSTYTLAGSTTDQSPLAYNQVYDTIFNEWTWNPPSGSMHLAFNASAKTPSPYVITGSLYFSNTGRLYFNSTGSIEYEWPWRIYGVSGFRPNHMLDAGITTSVATNPNAILPTVFCNSVDLGSFSFNAISLYKEIAFQTGSGVYGPYTEMTSSNPIYLSSSFNPSVGFKMKVKLTARPVMNYSRPVGNFVIGEYITGSTSLAKAKVINTESGSIVLGELTGSFLNLEQLTSSSSPRASVYATGSVEFLGTGTVLMPQPTSYINAMQWYTVVNTASLYPISTPTLTLTGLASGSTRVALITQTGSVILDDQNVIEDTYTYTYDYFTPTPVYIVIQNMGYEYLRLTSTLTENDLTIPVKQTIDRNYSNVAGP